MAIPPKMTWHPKDQAIAGTTDHDDLFTRLPRAEQRGTPLLPPLPIGTATIPITCRVCGVTNDVPISWSGLLCRQCRSDPYKAQDQAFNQWEMAQHRADADTMNRFLAIDQARRLTRTDRMQSFIALIRAGEDARKLGDDKRTKTILKDIAAGMNDAEVIHAAQARVAKGIEKALAAKDGLADLLRAEQRYHAARQEIRVVLDEMGQL